MGKFSFKLTNNENGSITEIKGCTIATILKAISSFIKDDQPIEYIKKGKRTIQVKDLHSKEAILMKEILK